MSVAYAAAWIAPLLLGSGLVAALTGRPRAPAESATALGYGFVLGAILSALAISLLGRIEIGRIVPLVAPLLIALGAAAWWWTLRRSPRAPRVAANDEPLHPLLWILIALLAAHAVLMADELLLRPMYPWDAWAAWLLKPKTWMLAGHLDRFVSPDEWLADPTGALRTAATWNYPEALGRLALWFASAWGEWNGGIVGLPWLALWLALLAGVYGQLRALGLGRGRAIVAIYAQGSLPLINVHVALAGYADLWIATLLAFACLAWMRGLEGGGRGHFVLAFAFAAMLPLVKLEGRIWFVIFAASMLYAKMSPRWRRVALALAPVIGIGVVAAYLLRWPLIAPALDRIGLTADTDALLARAPTVIDAVAEGLFAQYNWHLFGFAVALTLVVRFSSLERSPSLRVLGVFVLLGSAFLLALFTLTPAGKWAESYTAVNRLGLQVVPTMLAFAALLWRESAAEVHSGRVAEAASAGP
jgi:hypothetical protein